MPAVIVFGEIIFGIPEPLPKVPAGWTLHPAEEEWLRATGPDGLPYHLTKDGHAMLIVSEIPDFVKLEDVKPRKVVEGEHRTSNAQHRTSNEWSVETDAADDASSLRRGDKAEFVLSGARGRQTLERLAHLFNRAGITDEELNAVNDLLLF